MCSHLASARCLLHRYAIKVAAAGLASMTGGLSDEADDAEEGAPKSFVQSVFSKVFAVPNARRGRCAQVQPFRAQVSL